MSQTKTTSDPIHKFFGFATKFVVLGFVLGACGSRTTPDSPNPTQGQPPAPTTEENSADRVPIVSVEPNQESIQKNLVNTACVTCHTTATAKNRFVDLIDISKLIDNGTHSHIPGGARGNLIKPGCPRQSFFFTIMKEGKMPPAGILPDKDLLAVETWITSLKPNATCDTDEPGDDQPGDDEPGDDAPTINRFSP